MTHPPRWTGSYCHAGMSNNVIACHKLSGSVYKSLGILHLVILTNSYKYRSNQSLYWISIYRPGLVPLIPVANSLLQNTCECAQSPRNMYCMALSNTGENRSNQYLQPLHYITVVHYIMCFLWYSHNFHRSRSNKCFGVLDSKFIYSTLPFICFSQMLPQGQWKVILGSLLIHNWDDGVDVYFCRPYHICI